MFCLTHQERKVLLLIGGLILAGSVFRFLEAGNVSSRLLTDANRLVISKNIPSETRVNINKASQQDLETIPGIGAVIARRIINHRLTYGPFKNCDDLKQVKGIGDKKIEQVKGYLEF